MFLVYSVLCLALLHISYYSKLQRVISHFLHYIYILYLLFPKTLLLILCNVLIVLLFTNLVSISGERVAKRIYFDLKNFHSCIRRLNATHQTGCSSVLYRFMNIYNIDM